jgi:EAL domain-containing protein (putative c-di-GMP-specific phosphodiesterase class I)/GGDEF domain-containing protein
MPVTPLRMESGAFSAARVPNGQRADPGSVAGALARLSLRCAGDAAAAADLATLTAGYAEALENLGRTDHVTLLPNRLRFLDALARRTDLAGRTLVLVTLCEARQFNELLRALGQGFGDAFVRAGAQILIDAMPAMAAIYHVSVLSLAFLADSPVEAERFAIDLADRYERPVSCEGLDIPTRAGIGLVDFGTGPCSPAIMLRSALAAAQDSRSRQAGWARYDRQSDEAHQRSFHLVRDLGAALLADDQLSTRYQPRVSLADGRCASAEVLLRWNHPVLGPISPAEFIPLAEATALIEPITEWVLEASLRQSATWARQHLDVPLSVNVSALNLRAQGFAQNVSTLLDRHGVPPDRLELEVTEGAMTGDDETTAASLAAISRMGIDLAIDDFGTGYSNMGNLSKVPAQVLKIDRSFIQPLAVVDKHRQLVRSIIAMAHGLDYRVVAEGIEDQGTYDLLAGWHCDQGQGFHMSQPLLAGDFVAWLEAASLSQRPSGAAAGR